MLDSIRGFQKGALKPTETFVTTRDGKRFKEKKGDNEGETVLEFQGQVATPAYLAEAMAGISSLNSQRFDPAKNRWVSVLERPIVSEKEKDNEGEKEEERSTPLTSLKFVTYNVWFADVLWRERAAAMFAILEESEADFICLQEVTPRFLELLLETEWARKYYLLSDSNSSTVSPYGVLMLSRHNPISYSLHHMPTNMGRRFLMGAIDLQIAGVAEPVKIKIGTVHLESMANAEMRKAQLGIIFPLLAEGCDHSFLMGDFNFGGTSWENTNVEERSEYADIWPTLQGTDSGLSMPGEGRYDRVLVRSSVFVPTEIKLLGTEPVATDGKKKLKPSDHLGLYAVVAVK